MNIKQAKEYIENTVRLYLKKDEFGEYRIPPVRQRPIFLLGAPGIGKTAVMEQIAQEMGIALVSYSMTHHTRQSALGLPFITQKTYRGASISVSEYTMSEIIASVYDICEDSGIREGILFLDEINCVSETLAPAMLQFLQYKTFGRHRVPEGWVIVTAGNPPEYNKSVREFDVATLDRLKVMEVEPDYGVWKEYAGEKRIHNAVTSYLDLKKEHFYRIEMTAKGRSYVTARGWEDLSEILALHEEENLPVDGALVGQYLRNDRVAEEFCAYYELYRKYKNDYNIADILDGRFGGAVPKAKEAPFDERLSLLGMLLDAVQGDMKEVMEQAAFLTDLKNVLKGVGSLAEKEGCSGAQILERLEALSQARKKMLDSLQNAGALSQADRRKHKSVIRFLEDAHRELRVRGDAESRAAYGFLKECFRAQVAGMKCETDKAQSRLRALFSFAEEAFGQGNELLILLTELTAGSASSRFIAAFGSPEYGRLSEDMMLAQRRDDLKERIAALDL
nr:AAA family ATPase [uncultured Acetatifactor sp.]